MKPRAVCFSENPMEIVNAAKKENTPKETSNSVTTSERSMKDLSSSEHSSPVVTSTTENDLVSSMKNTVSEASSKISSLLNINLSPPTKNSHTNSATSLKSGISKSSLQLNSRHSPHTATSTENHISSSCTQEISTSNQSTVTKLMDNSNENHSLAETAAGESLSVCEDTSGDLLMDTDDEAEKEDVTATLALLNSMASELDEVLDVEGTL